MNITVCAKQIPDPAAPGDLDPDDHTLKRDGKLILDESDMYGVEMALQLVDAAGENFLVENALAILQPPVAPGELVYGQHRVVARVIRVVHGRPIRDTLAFAMR